MFIESFDIALNAGRSYQEAHERSIEFKSWTGRQGDPMQPPERPSDKVVISDEAKERLSSIKENRYLDSEEMDITAGVDNEMLIRKLLIEALTGTRISVKDLSAIKDDAMEIEAGGEEIKDAHTGPDREGWGLIYNDHERRTEDEAVAFTANGVVRTTDGEGVAFTLELGLQRTSIVENTIDVRAGDAVVKDPLVINLDGKAAGLTDTKFSFDIDSDGNDDKISFVKGGSGFLFFDINNDGRATNGGELFGPSTGHGFNELKAHDSDSNSWIDESDPVYSRLRLWMKDPSGKDSFSTLGQNGIGAIYLGSSETGFDLLNPANRLDGIVRRTGVFLKEDGTPGIIQQIDLAV
jgi:hypothetical protein